MIRLLLLSLFLAACSAAPAQPGVEATLPPAWALQDALATGTAAARSIEATATAQVNLVATQARASVALAEAQTQAAIPGAQTSTAIFNANLIATATQGAAYQATQLAADLTDRQAQRDQAAVNTWAWIIIGGAAVAVLTVVGCRVLIRLGQAHEKKSIISGILVVRRADDDPIGYFLPGERPQYFALPSGPQLPPVFTAEHEQERQCRAAWCTAVHEVSNTAAIMGSWSVNNISTRSPEGTYSEDTVARVQVICAEIGALVNYEGTRGWDWAPTWHYTGLGEALDNGVYFTLPRKPPTPDESVGALLWPILPGQSKPKPSKAKVAKAKAVV